jgi:hypothetical protein
MEMADWESWEGRETSEEIMMSGVLMEIGEPNEGQVEPNEGQEGSERLKSDSERSERTSDINH